MKTFKEYLLEKARHKKYLYGVHNYPSGGERRTSEGKQIIDLAFEMKTGRGFEIVAPQMAKLVNGLIKNPVLIPIPNSKGDTSNNMELIKNMLRYIPNGSVADILTSIKKTPSHELRKQGKVGEMPIIYAKDDPDLSPNLVLVDNVITTGNTIFATHKYLRKYSPYSQPIAVCWAIAHDTKKKAFDWKQKSQEQNK